MTRRVLITGMGCVSGLGRGAEQGWESISRGEGAIRALDRPHPSGVPAWAMNGPAAWIEPQEAGIDLVRGRSRQRLGQLDPLASYALEATMEAIDEAGLADHPVLRDRTAISLGCGSSGNATMDVAYERLYAAQQPKAHPQTIPTSMISAPASNIAALLGVHGPTFVLASACASSAHALGEAMHMVRSGRVDVAIAGGSEACLSLGAWAAWRSLGVMAPDSCRPFSRDRQGLVLGEGAAIVILEAEDHAVARGARILGELAGYCATSDAAHITAPDRAGIEAAIVGAHRDAAISTDRRVLISAHGTGTALNDATETAAIRAIYGRALDDDLVIATKSAHGHLIGASGALEFLLGMKALMSGVAPPVLNYLGPDPDCDLPLALSPTNFDADVLVSNSFAFGGLNAVLIGKRPS
jgi:nodulation protein E